MKYARDIMTRKVITVRGDTAVARVSHILIKNKLSGVPVTDRANRLLGFISEKDIIKSVGSRKFSSKKVKDIMTQKVIAVQEDDRLDYVSQIFTEHPFRRVPVVRNGKVVGIISRRDVMNNLLTDYY